MPQAPHQRQCFLRPLHVALMGAGLLASSVLFPPRARSADDAPKTPPTAPERGAPADGGQRGEPGMMLDRLHAIVSELNLTDDQKPKVEEQFAKAHKELESLKAKGQDAGEREAIGKAMNELREGVGGILTEDQKKELRAKLEQAGTRGPGAGRPLAAFRERLEKLDLTADQKSKIDAIIKDQQEKARELMKDAAGDRDAAREKILPLLEEGRRKIHDILTPEQQTKLRELTQQEGGGQGPGAQRGATTKKAE